MEYNIWFDVCAIFVLGAMLFSTYTKHKIPLFQNRIFTMLVWMCLFSTTADMVSGIWNSSAILHTASSSTDPIYLASMVYFISRNLMPLCYLLYILAILGIELRSFKKRLIIFLPFAIDLFLIFITPFTNAVFYISAEGSYVRGQLLFILYINAFLYLVASVYYIIRYRRSIPLLQIFAMLTFFAIALFTVAIQAYVPTLLIEGFGSTISLLIMYFTIHKPEDLEDSSTGFLNKKIFSMIISTKTKQKIPFTLLLIRINDFTLLENSYGVEIIDKLMSQIASFIQHYQKNPAYRIAEAKIAIITNKSKQEVMQKVITDFQNRFSKSWSVAEHGIILSEFYSVIRFPDDADTVEEILELVNAVNAKKNLGKKTIIDVKELNIEQERRRLKIDSIVKEAFNKHSLNVVYQPIYSVSQKRFTSAEALLRLKDDALGNIPPDEFIPIAEKNGSIVKMDEFVLDSVCHFTAFNHIRELGIEYIEINLSAIDCIQEKIVERLLDCINSYELMPEQINLELTETAMNALPDNVYTKINYLSQKGISFSLDDYGTGYSNLSRIATLPFEIIKIDKSIAQEAFNSNAIKVILDSTVQMLKRLDKKILVEGIETKEQADYMERIGCDYIQGYYYSRPISAEEFLKLMNSSIS